MCVVARRAARVAVERTARRLVGARAARATAQCLAVWGVARNRRHRLLQLLSGRRAAVQIGQRFVIVVATAIVADVLVVVARVRRARRRCRRLVGVVVGRCV